MAVIATPEASQGIWGAVKGALGLFSDMNKTDVLTEGQNPTPISEYESSMDEVKVMELVKQWKSIYSTYYSEIEKGQKLSFSYWVGKQKDESGKQLGNLSASPDNLIFEAVETFLPIATRANPEPLVQADPSDVGQEIAKDVKVALSNWADTHKLRRKLAKMTRGWLLNRIGVIKLSWNPHTKEIEADVVDAKKMIFDKDGYVDESGIFRGEYEGEKKQATADVLKQMFPKKKELINKKSGDKSGTKLSYIEWWYRGTDIFYTLDDSLLGKYKNPNWNYDGKEMSVDPMTQEPVEMDIQGTNHLKEILSPYRYLSIFNTGEQPHDNTSLILQNIPLQDKINRRDNQIDDNVKNMNNGIVVSGTAFTEEQASQAASALRRGVAIRVPNGDVGKSVLFPQRPGLPADVYNSQKDARQELRNIFGTAGSSAEGVKSQETVRGKVLVNQMDSSRIGGGITEYIEQIADAVYNQVVQMMFVFYDEEHFVTAAGATDGMQLITLKNDKFPLLKTLSVTVKEGSLVPKDPLTQRNEAIDLWSAGAIDPMNLFKKLDFPNPTEATQQLILWQMLQKGAIQPQMYLPTFQVAGQGQPMPGQPMQPPQDVGGPAVNPIGPAVPTNVQTPGTPESMQAQSQQLLNAVPLK
jgi:hypothetical protein